MHDIIMELSNIIQSIKDPALVACIVVIILLIVLIFLLLRFISKKDIIYGQVLQRKDDFIAKAIDRVNTCSNAITKLSGVLDSLTGKPRVNWKRLEESNVEMDEENFQGSPNKGTD